MYRLYELPMWAHAVLFIAVLLLALEGGFRLGLRQHRARPDADKTVRGDVTLTSMLALLGLMLAFTYAFTLSRADTRKQAVVKEANSLSAFALILAALMLVILDFDLPLKGSIRVSSESLVSLVRDMEASLEASR